MEVGVERRGTHATFTTETGVHIPFEDRAPPLNSVRQSEMLKGRLRAVATDGKGPVVRLGRLNATTGNGGHRTHLEMMRRAHKKKKKMSVSDNQG